MNLQEARSTWAADKPHFEARGAILPGISSYIPDGFSRNYAMALDALPTLTTDPNSGVPAMLTTMIDPAVFRVLFAANKAAIILGEEKKGSWVDQTAMFPITEHTGEVSSYDDYANNGRAGVNTNWPQRQAYLFQTIKEYGELELERAGLARINWVSEIDQAAADILNRYSNLTYFFGVLGMQNYGLLNDPNLTASLTPAPKVFGNNLWVTAGVVTATANEVYADIQSLYLQLVAQSAGLVDQETPMTLALSPTSATALTATNSFNVSVSDLLKKNFPKIKVETAVQYGARSAANPNGVAGGNFVQLIAAQVEGQKTGHMAFNEKMRAHPIIRDLSSFRQKITAGTWGAIIRQSIGISSMLGI